VSVADEVKGHLLSDRYLIHDVVGRGGVADVCRATDQVLHREVAVKLLRDSADDESARSRFVAEARLLAGLSHPNLVTLYDAGVATARPYLVMELVDGPPLDRILSGGPVGESRVREIAAQLADALAYAHGLGVVHRDVKPANVLCGHDGRARLADFGIARLVGDTVRHTLTGQTIGTAAYLSPEQVRGEDVDSPTDVYSLGLVLLEALTGECAFPGSATESAVARLSRPPEIPDHVDSSLHALLDAMTSLDPTRRPGAIEVSARIGATSNEVARRAEAQTEVLATRPMTSVHAPAASLAEPRSGSTGLVDRAGEAIERAARNAVDRLRGLPGHQQGVLAALLALLAFIVIVGVASNQGSEAPSDLPSDIPPRLEQPLAELHRAVEGG